MKKLIKVTHNLVCGYDGSGENFTSFILSENELTNEEKLTQEDVIEWDEIYCTYNTYENMGDISDEEINTLKKFKIVK